MEVGALIGAILFTAILYGIAPIACADAKKAPIEKKKYLWQCFGINFMVMFAFSIISGNVSTGAPYVLWTSIASAIGVKMLEKKGFIIEKDYKPVGEVKSVLNCETEEERIAYFEEEYKDYSEKKLNRIINGEYSKETKIAVNNILNNRKKQTTSIVIQDEDSNTLMETTESDGEEIAQQIMFCRRCGNKLNKESKFCSKCGLKIE